MRSFNYGKDHLTASIALGLARKEIKGQFLPEVKHKIEESASAVSKIAQGEKVVYGINTGFGPLCTSKISAQDTTTLQENLL
ncbi:MAG TPA: histidine ammonia-lyase, partial [Algoriphagus sp.]|nr:histidine ammonia-lyase [Algoriphagus sp.]